MNWLGRNKYILCKDVAFNSWGNSTFFFFGVFCCYLAALVSSCSLTFCDPSSISGCSPLPACSCFDYWIQRKASPLEAASLSKCLWCCITAEKEGLKGEHTESCETLVTQLLLTIAQIIITQFDSGSIRPLFSLEFLTLTLLWRNIPNERLWNQMSEEMILNSILKNFRKGHVGSALSLPLKLRVFFRDREHLGAEDRVKSLWKFMFGGAGYIRVILQLLLLCTTAWTKTLELKLWSGLKRWSWIQIQIWIS